MTLIGRKPPSKLEIRDAEPDRGLSSKINRLTDAEIQSFLGMSKTQPQRLDRNQWKQYTSLMSDSGRFVDILHGVSWEHGLNPEIAQGILYEYHE